MRLLKYRTGRPEPFPRDVDLSGISGVECKRSDGSIRCWLADTRGRGYFTPHYLTKFSVSGDAYINAFDLYADSVSFLLEFPEGTSCRLRGSHLSCGFEYPEHAGERLFHRV